MPTSTKIITLTQLRAQIGRVTDDPRFSEGIEDSVLQGIIDRHVDEFDSRAEEMLFTDQVPREALRHLSEPVEIELTTDTMVARGDMPAGYIRWSYGAFDSNAKMLGYEDGLLVYAEVSPFATSRYRISGAHVEVLPKDLDSVQLYLVTTDAARDALLSGSYSGMGTSAADINRKIIAEAMAAIKAGIDYAERVVKMDSVEH